MDTLIFLAQGFIGMFNKGGEVLVKKGDYLRFNHEQRQREMQLFLDGKIKDKELSNNAQLRTKYEKLHGDIYAL